MEERWKELKGNRETYLVSDKGNIRTKTRAGARGYVVQGHELKQHDNSNGYLRVNLHLEDDEKVRSHLVHRLVAEAFIPEVEGKPFVNHIDGNKHNNDVTNLEWCNRSENEKHAWATDLKKDTATKGELHGMHKLTTKDVIFIKKNHKRNGGEYKTGELASMFSVNPQTITEIVGGRAWKNVEA